MTTIGTHGNRGVKRLAWAVDKDGRLRRERGVSFERVAAIILASEYVDLFDHPNQQRYPGQRVFVVLLDDYAYLVPFVESEAGYFLKTIIPSRRATKQYRGDNDET